MLRRINTFCSVGLKLNLLPERTTSAEIASQVGFCDQSLTRCLSEACVTRNNSNKELLTAALITQECPKSRNFF